jgi:hypothetical protein
MCVKRNQLSRGALGNRVSKILESTTKGIRPGQTLQMLETTIAGMRNKHSTMLSGRTSRLLELLFFYCFELHKTSKAPKACPEVCYFSQGYFFEDHQTRIYILLHIMIMSRNNTAMFGKLEVEA